MVRYSWAVLVCIESDSESHWSDVRRHVVHLEVHCDDDDGDEDDDGDNDGDGDDDDDGDDEDDEGPQVDIYDSDAGNDEYDEK